MEERWKINFTVTYKTIPKEDKTITVGAKNIVSALAKFIREVEKPLEKAGAVRRVDVWKVERTEGSYEQETT